MAVKQFTLVHKSGVALWNGDDLAFSGSIEPIPDGEGKAVAARVAGEDKVRAVRVELTQAGEEVAGDGRQVRAEGERIEIRRLETGEQMTVGIREEEAEGFAVGEESPDGETYLIEDGLAWASE